MNDPIVRWPEITAMAADVRTGRTPPAEPARDALLRIGRDDRRWRAFTSTLPPAATGEGPLAGVPFGVKDNFDVRGRVTHAGTDGAGREPAGTTAAAITLLTRAGAVLVGTTNMSELACAAVTENPWYGVCRNPWDPSHGAGGSSGGSAAAVSGGLVPFALGTDTGGSVLIPAALTGICGLRPTSGRISTAGVVLSSPTLDTVGVLAARVTDLRAVADVLGAQEPGPHGRAFPLPLAGLRVGVLHGWFRERCSAGVLAQVDGAVAELSSLGARCEPVLLPGVEDVLAAGRTIVWAEAARGYREFTGGHTANPAILRRLRDGDRISAADYRAAQDRRERWRRLVSRTFAEADILVSATTPSTAPRVGADQEEVTRTLVALTYPVSMAGTPAVSVPAGVSEGLPVGLQMIGPWDGERRLLDVATVYLAAKYRGTAPVPGGGNG
ncbi:amidase [Spongiactinospora sp. 9N601]|uniref:amidase n=1 Tax=Spongiactinospora sp. 9N601 TaxID=3375149 RepID=UPI0037A20B0B